MKNLTDFLKTVETGMDPRLQVIPDHTFPVCNWRNRMEVVCWNINICLKNSFHLERRLKFWRKTLWQLSCRTWFDCLFNVLEAFRASKLTWNDIIFSLFRNLKDSLQKTATLTFSITHLTGTQSLKRVPFLARVQKLSSTGIFWVQ